MKALQTALLAGVAESQASDNLANTAPLPNRSTILTGRNPPSHLADLRLPHQSHTPKRGKGMKKSPAVSFTNRFFRVF